METILQNVARVLEAPTASDEVQQKDHESDVDFSGNLLAQRVETMERKRQQDAAAKAASAERQRATTYTDKTGRAARVMSSPECDSMIQQEMGVRKRVTRWHHLEKCFKWQAVQEYVALHHPDRQHDEALLADLRRLLCTHQLDKLIKYDHAQGVLTDVRHPLLVSTASADAGASETGSK